MNRFIGITTLAWMLALAQVQTPAVMAAPVDDGSSVTQLLERAIYQEQSVGDLDAALKLYRQILSENEGVQRVAAEAQLHIGLIHLKRGQQKQATAVLQQLADRYPGQQERIEQSRVAMSPAIREAIAKIREHYIDEFVDDGTLTEGALRGVLGNLDRYSSFMDADALANMSIGTAGKLVGVGAVLALKEGKVMIRGPLPGSPALKAGLASGDTILAIDGVRLDGFAEAKRLPETLKRMRGKTGDVVELLIADAETGDDRLVPIARREVNLPSVSGLGRDKDDRWIHRLNATPQIGYVRIQSITKQSPGEVRRIVQELNKDKLKGLIIDLRDNGGGLMSSTVEIADMFLRDGLILDVRGRRAETRKFSANDDELLQGVPIAILVNRNTASAAEILAGALKDRGRAIVVGERTFGKGTVQALIPLQSGGAIKLTTARFFLPSGASIERPTDADETDVWGIDPSDGLKVDLSDEERQTYTEFLEQVTTIGDSDSPPEAPSDRVLAEAVRYLRSISN